MNFSHRFTAQRMKSVSTPMRVMCGILTGYLWIGIGFSGAENRTCAADSAQEKITYDDHIRPIFRQYCLACHSAGSKKGDLAIDAYVTTLEGGASGEVVYPGELESSRLWDLVTHQDEPAMPPDADKLPEDTLALIRRWIEGGTLENSGSVAEVSKKPSLAMRTPASTGKPEGPAAMPETMVREPVVYSTRAGAISALAASPWAPLIAVAGQRQVTFYHAETATVLGVVPFLEGLPQVVTFTRDGSRVLVAGGRGAAIGLATIYDVKTGSRLLTVGDEYDAVHAADVNAKQTLIALGGPQKVVRVFRADDHALAFEIRKHTEWITAIAFSPNGEILITADRNGGAFLWEAETGREIASLRGHAGAVTSASWRADSQVVATSGVDGSVRLWDREEGNQVKSWTAHGGGVTSVIFAADGRLVSTGRDRAVKLWKVDGGPLKNLTSFGDIALHACITHDGKRVAAGGFSGEVRLLDVESGEQVGLLAANPPTLAMRVASTADSAATATRALAAATAAKQEADRALAAAHTEATRRAEVVAHLRRDLSAVRAARDTAFQELEARQHAVAAQTARVTEAAKALVQASSEVASAETAFSQSRTAQGDLAAADARLTAATDQVKQTIEAIETARAAVKTAIEAHRAAEVDLAAKNAAVAAAKKRVDAAQSAVDQFVQQVPVAESEVAAKVEQLASRKAAVVVAQEAHQAARQEQQAFAAAPARLEVAIEQAEEQIAARAQALADAVARKEEATVELQSHKAVADEAAEKLAAAKADFERLKAAMDEAQAVVDQKTQAATDAELAHLRAAAAAAQAAADRETFEKAATLRAKYRMEP